MLTASFINSVRDCSISEIIGHYITLKKHGSSSTACCPFHDEKSPSFTVTEAKGIYKCFGCGASGDVIQFVVDHEKQTFQEACITIAGIAHLQVEYEDQENTEQYKAIISAAEAQEKVLNLVIPMYRDQLHKLSTDHPAKEWLQQRGIDQATIDEWQLGWSPEDWRYITPTLVSANLHEAAAKIGVIKRGKDDNNYDGYRSRIIFPITDKNGRYIGLGGRYIKVVATDSRDIPKYINPAQCELYNKSAVFYGLKNAIKSIQKTGHAYITEGYMDVVSPHRSGTKNVVATCGTAFTTDQMRLIRRYTTHIRLWRDMDAAGQTATASCMPELLQLGFTVEVVMHVQKDPDDYVQSTDTYNNTGGWQFPEITDGISWFAKRRWQDVEEIYQRSRAKADILQLVANVCSEIERNHYIDLLCKTYNWKIPETKKEFAAILKKTEIIDNLELDDDDEKETIKIPDWVSEEQKERFLTQGFVAVNRKHNGKPMVGYYSFNSAGKTEITNFIVTPLFHIYAGVESRYMLQIYNGYRHAVLDLQARLIPSPEQFQSFTVSEGNYLIFGSKPQWLRIASELLQQFPRCMELNYLGWQAFGFFAFVDKIYVPGEGLKDLDNWGIFKHKTGKEQEENFLVPASCEAYRQLQRTGDDPFEADRYLTYKLSPVTFSTWANQMQRVYHQNGIVGVAYAILTIFRDIVFDIDNNCPHLYAFGEPSSGKSKWAESITAVFYFRRSAFNLNSGTDFAFFNYMQKFPNCPAHLNEFEIEVIKQEWFQAIKGAFDGEGRERGKGGSRNRTEIMRVKSTLILTGQKLVTADDNSVVTRSVIEPFSTREDLSEADKIAYNTLKGWEAAGMSSMILELLAHRSVFQRDYKEQFDSILSEWRRQGPDAQQLNQRILQNQAHMATGYSIASRFITLPQSAEVYKQYCYKQAVKWSHFIRSSDTLSEFWRTLEFLTDQQQIQIGWDFDIEEKMSVKIRVNRNEETEVQFDKPTKILYIRLNNIHKLFQMAYRSRTGKEAMNIENLLHYFSSRKYFVGPIKQRRFKRFISVTENTSRQNGLTTTHQPITEKKLEERMGSCYAFVYEDLGIEIERFDGNQNDSGEPTPAAAGIDFSKHLNSVQSVLPLDETPIEASLY